jgi:imidazolonepropionase-like amidohydrolase
MTDIPIPPEVVEAAERTYRTVPLHTSHADAIRAAIAAALNAWKGMYRNEALPEYDELILPLPQEPGNG